MEFELAEYVNFKTKFKDHEYDGLRFGQAFYNHFNLHKCANQDLICRLYELDGEDAQQFIKEKFTFN